MPETNNETTQDCNINEIHIYTYNFDSPLLSESGMLRIEPNLVMVRFPDKKNHLFKDAFSYNQNVSLIVNNQTKFSYQWLPIFTYYDFFRIKDILFKAFKEYIYLLNYDYYNISQIYKYYDEYVTHYKNKFYQLDCFENNFVTTIELNFETLNCHNQVPINFQMFIGTNMIFCLQRDLGSLPLSEIYCLAVFLLEKMIKI